MSSLLPLNEAKELHLLDNYLGSRIEYLNSLNLNVHPLFTEEKYLNLLSTILDINISGLNKQEARELLSLFLKLNKYAGTKWALKRVLKIISKNITIKEWFSYSGEPYYFIVEVLNKDIVIDLKFYELLQRYIDKYKNVRSVLEKIVISTEVKLSKKYALATLSGEAIKVEPLLIQELKAKAIKNYSLACSLNESINLNLDLKL